MMIRAALACVVLAPFFWCVPVLADDAEAIRVRVLTYNIHHGEGVDGKLDLERIAKVIKAVEPDLVSVQEVDQGVERTGKVDQPAELAKLTKLNGAFGGNFKFQGGDYGNLVLSRWPIKRQHNHKLPSFDDGEPRGVLEVEVELPGGAGPLSFLATHLDHRADEKERLASAKVLNELKTHSLALLAGDLNAVPDSKALQTLRTVWTASNEKPLPTIPVEKPNRQIDYVLFKPESRWKVVETKVLEEAVASDHRAVLTILEVMPPASGWTAKRVLDAAEAHQAAAADEKFVYAITNAHVAKYDRESGKRIAVSKGAAKHLNSGFVWEGKLYCAHSNFPATPEQSEIKVLDVESMELSTFKDFRNFGGSLTWAVHHDSHWWCNFARYGDNNDATFLVKLDPHWNEQGRWTYPGSVIRELGRNSLSGGIWREDELLVTGHDDPVVFRLRLPKQGDALELVGKLPIPFSGQGFAHDPVSDGLVGINRAKRQIVFAMPQCAESK